MWNVLKSAVTRRHLLLLAGDILCIALALYLAAVLRLTVFSARSIREPFDYLWSRPAVLAFVTFAYLLAFYFTDLYSLTKLSRRENFVRPMAAAHAGAFLALAMIFFYTPETYGRAMTAMQTALLFGLMWAWRRLFLWLIGVLKQPARVMIIGAGGGGTQTLQALRSAVSQDYQVVGFVDDDPEKAGMEIGGVRVLGSSADLDVLIRKHRIDQLVLAITRQKKPELVRKLVHLSQNGVYLTDALQLYERLTGRIPAYELTDMWFLTGSLGNTRFFQRRVKRLLDILMATFGLVAGAIPAALAAIAIKSTSRGPVLFKQGRVGRLGRPFHIIKLRTMVDDAEAETGAVMASENDPRVTRVGRFLRRTRIDEIPQLWNVLKGDMSMVGPRPEREVFVERFQEEIPFYRERLAVQPGLTGWSQVKHPYAASVHETAAKLEYDLYYVKNMSFGLDLLILAMTVKTIVSGGGR